MREDVEFAAEDGVLLRGWHYAPDGVEGPAPLVVMAHGFSAVKEHLLDDYAEHFAAGGLAATSWSSARWTGGCAASSRRCRWSAGSPTRAG